MVIEFKIMNSTDISISIDDLIILFILLVLHLGNRVYRELT